MKEIQAWYIFYTHPRTEKKVSEMLMHHGYEVFLPMKQEIHYWKNRQKKQISIPLFPNYIFVWTSRSYVYEIIKLPKIVRYLSYNSNPSTISSEEIDLIKKMLVSNIDLSVENVNILGENVKIVSGPFRGIEGTLYKRNGNNRFLMQIKNTPFNLSIKVESQNLRIVTPT